MQNDQPTIEEQISLGKKRMQELIDIQSLDPGEYFSRLQSLSWIHIKEVIDNPLSDRGWVNLAILELIHLLQDIVLYQRGPGILGHFNQLELNFSPRVNASYDVQSRVVRLNLGMLLYINELEDTYQWLDSILCSGSDQISIDALLQVEAPPSVQEEFHTLFQISEAEGMPVSGKFGISHPIGNTSLRFIVAHELSHLIDFAESPKLRESWREAAWSDYADALGFCLSAGWIDQAQYAALQRSALAQPQADQWVSEFLADGMGFYTVSKAETPNFINPALAYTYLQIAIEVFFYSLIAAYRGDVGAESHPSPILRSATIRAGQRKLRRVNWQEFLINYWGPGFITTELLEKTIRKIGGKS